MGCKCTRGIANNFREELWSYFALSGLLFLHIGIVLMVYALKRATAYPAVLEGFGLGLIIMGIAATLVSWYAHRQHRQKRDMCDSWAGCACCPCSRNHNKMDTDDNSEEAVVRVHRKRKSRQPGSFKMFSTLEFRTYAEFIKKDTVGVETNGITPELKRYRVEPARDKQRPLSRATQVSPQATVFVNPRYPDGQQSPVLIKAVATPIFVRMTND